MKYKKKCTTSVVNGVLNVFAIRCTWLWCNHVFKSHWL